MALLIDNGDPVRFKGNTAAKRNLASGMHEIKVQGEIGGQMKEATRVITVPAGGACSAELTFS